MQTLSHLEDSIYILSLLNLSEDSEVLHHELGGDLLRGELMQVN